MGNCYIEVALFGGVLLQIEQGERAPACGVQFEITINKGLTLVVERPLRHIDEDRSRFQLLAVTREDIAEQ